MTRELHIHHEDSDLGPERNLLCVDHHHLPDLVLLLAQVPLPQVWRWQDVSRRTTEFSRTQGETGRWGEVVDLSFKRLFVYKIVFNSSD